MNAIAHDAVRPAAVFGLVPGAVARGQNFWVQTIEGGNACTAESEQEMLLLLPDGGARIAGDGPALDAPGRSVCVLPPGRYTVTQTGPGRAALVASSRPDLAVGTAVNQADYAQPDPRIVPTGGGYRRMADAGTVRVVAIDGIAPPADKPRLKMFQTATLSINWVEYDGPRDRTQLSPHSHADFEQGSLALYGDYLHHLRVQWGPNADLWQDDRHLPAPSPSMLTVPVRMVHTTEGVGPGRHLLIDVFSPPRADFIAKGWVANAAEYGEAPAAAMGER